MSVNDTLSDMIARIRNAQKSKLAEVEVLYSKLNMNVLKVLEEEGYIGSFSQENKRPGIDVINVNLRYDRQVGVIKESKRVSKPGRRVYYSIDDIKSNQPFNGLGLLILSTPKGVISDKQALREKVGGEVLCKVF